MTTFFKGLALLVAVSCLAWISVLWHWRTSAYSPDSRDMLAYLVLLPLAGFGLVLLLRWGWRAATGWRASSAAAAAQSAKADAATAEAPPAEPPAPPLQVLSAGLRCACAEDVNALLQAAQAGKPLPVLDEELRHDDGLPIMSVRIAELPLDDTRAQLELLASKMSGQAQGPSSGPASGSSGGPTEGHAGGDEGGSAGDASSAQSSGQSGRDPANPSGDADGPPYDGPELPPHLVRALAALAAPLAKVLQGLQPWWPLFDPGQPQAKPPERGLDLLLAWPASWTEAERALADAWVRARLDTASLGPIDPAHVGIASLAVSGVELWVEAQRRLREQRRDGRQRLLLLASAHSDLSEAAVAALARDRRLFMPAQHPKGLMPAEGAAALLLAPHDWPASPDASDTPVQLHPAVALKRDKSIEAAGSVSSQTVVDALAGAIQLARLEPVNIAKLVCDADRHSQRGTELFGATLKVLPQLDAAEDLCLTAAVAGHGQAGALMVLAGAAARAAAEKKPCLGLALGDTHWRLAVVAQLPPPPAA
jgi:hypothetical protein